MSLKRRALRMKQNEENLTIKLEHFDEWLCLGEEYDLNVFTDDEGKIRYNIYPVTNGETDVANQVGEGNIEFNLVTGLEIC